MNPADRPTNSGEDREKSPKTSAVRLHDVGKRFPVSDGWLGRYNKIRTLRTGSASTQETGRARTWALRFVDMDISFGEILGFIGPNGAGKTTLIKVMSGLVSPSEGEVQVLGETFGRDPTIPDGIGLVAENQSFIPYLSGLRNLKMLAGLRAVASDEDVAETLRLVGLDPNDSRPTRSYSLGMRQRLGLAQALMEKPRLLLLDEPTNGLDPAGIVEMRGLLRRLADEGVAIFLASHLLTEVEKICDRVLLVKDGRIVSEIDQHEAGRFHHEALQVVLERRVDLRRVLEWCKESGAQTTTVVPTDAESALSAPSNDGGRYELELRTIMTTPDVITALVLSGVRIESVARKSRTLEDQFMELMGSSG